MSLYDDTPHEELPELKVCPHNFIDTTTIIREYTNELCDKVIEYGREGKLIEGFAGKYNICMDAMCEWISKEKEYPDFNSAVKIAVSACVHYWMEELQYAIQKRDWNAVAVIRSILDGLTKSIPKELREGLFTNLKMETAEDRSSQAEDEKQRKLMEAMNGNSNSE